MDNQTSEPMLNDPEGRQLVENILDRKAAQAEPEGGWAFPNSSNRAKAHYFVKPAMLEPSICGRWAYVGLPVQGGLDSPASLDDCRECRRRVTALQVEASK